MGTVIRDMLPLTRSDDVLLWEATGVREYSCLSCGTMMYMPLNDNPLPMLMDTLLPL